MSKGWIKIHRSIMDHWLIHNPEYFTAWIIILMEVNHKESSSLLGNNVVSCKRGQSLNSLDTWAGKFPGPWDKSKVRRFFKVLKDSAMIDTEGLSKTTRLTVCNYDTYQDCDHTNDTQVTRSRHARDTKQEGKNAKNGKKKDIFVQFWNAYPRKVNKKRAEELFVKLKQSDIEELMDFMPAFQKWAETKEQRYIPHATTFINGRRWEDELEKTEDQKLEDWVNEEDDEEETFEIFREAKLVE